MVEFIKYYTDNPYMVIGIIVSVLLYKKLATSIANSPQV